MPMYEYACAECSHTFETLVFSGDEPTSCPQCGDGRLDRLLSLPARPKTATATPLPGACGSGPPCGAPWCQRPG